MLWIALSVWDLLCFQMNGEIAFPGAEKNVPENFVSKALTV